MLNLPYSTEVNRNISKNKFYEKADISSALKESFVNDIEKIIWTNKLSPKTFNISGSDNFKELEVFHIKLKKAKFNPKILEAIDKAIPYYILFVLEYDGKYQIWLGYKEKSANSTNKANIIRYFNSEWSKEPILVLQGNKLESIYENFLSQLSDGLIDTSSEEDLKTKVNQTVEINKLEQQIAKLILKRNNEKQFNRQCELNKEIKLLRAKLKELTNNG